MHNLAYLGHFSLLLSCLWIARTRYPKLHAPAVSAAFTIAALIIGFWASFPATPFWDFLECYYPAGEAARLGDVDSLRGLYIKTVQGFVNIPIVAYLFAPFSLLGKNMAAVTYVSLGLVAVIFTWWILADLAALSMRERHLLLALMLANGAVINSIKFGNTSHFILCLLTSGLWLLKHQRAFLAGALLGFAAVLKPALGLFGFFFLFRLDVRGLLGFAFSGTLTLTLSIMVFGLDLNLFWFQTSILQFGHQWFGTFSVQSIAAYLLRLRSDPNILTTWMPVQPSSMESLIFKGFVISAYLLSLTVCWISRTKPATTKALCSLELQFMLIVCLAIITSPLSWSHYFVWLLIPVAYLLKNEASSAFSSQWLRRGGWIAALLLSPLIMWPYSFDQSAVRWIYEHIVVSHQLIGAIIWLAIILAAMMSHRARSSHTETAH